MSLAIILIAWILISGVLLGWGIYIGIHLAEKTVDWANGKYNRRYYKYRKSDSQ